MRKLIAIVGRPNVGKSRLFNRLAVGQDAIVHDFEGVTRDRQYGEGEWFGRPYAIVDTGGFVPSADEPLLAQMRNQAQLAIEEADIILFMMDGRAGLLAGDREIAAMLRQTDKPVFYAVNKVDAYAKRDEVLVDFYELGADLYATSAEHGDGIDPLMDAIAEHLPKEEIVEAEPPYARIAVVGKPNAGKSSTVNALLGEDRLLTSEIPGTTRDAIDTKIKAGDREYLVIDTAGLRRKKSISQRLEEFAVMQAIRSIDRADIALLVLDATQGVSTQDKKIASVAANRGRAFVILVNKWDLVEKDERTAGQFVQELCYEMPFMSWAPVIFTSAKTGQRVHKILPEIDRVFDQYTKRIQTSEVNRFLQTAIAQHQPPIHQNRRLKFFFATQVATRPPTFMFVVNDPQGVAPSYRRYLENQLREAFGFEGTPIRTVMRSRKQREEYETE